MKTNGSRNHSPPAHHMNISHAPTLLLAAITLLLSGNTIAQSQQTAEGAQAFLSQTVSSGQVNASLVIKEVRMTRENTYLEKRLIQGCVPKITTKREVVFPVQAKVTRVTSAGNQCMTVIPTPLDFQPHRYEWDHPDDCDKYTSRVKTIVPEISPAPTIDWSKSTIERGKWRGVEYHYNSAGAYLRGGYSENTVLVSVPDKNHGTIYFNLTASTELTDRIEYAVKFLQMSCDSAADTGF